MIKLPKNLLNFILACFLSFLSACGGTKSLPHLQQTSALPAKNICNIAVVPFLNESSYKQGGFIVYRVFMSELTRVGGYNVVQEGDIREMYRQMKIYPNRLPNYDQITILGNRLAAEVLVTGRIIQMTEDIVEETRQAITADVVEETSQAMAEEKEKETEIEATEEESQ